MAHLDVLGVIDLDGTGTIDLELLATSLQIFDGSVFNDDVTEELYRATYRPRPSVSNKGLDLPIEDVFGPFWRALVRRIGSLEANVACAEAEANARLAAHADANKNNKRTVKAEARVAKLEAELDDLRRQLRAEAASTATAAAGAGLFGVGSGGAGGTGDAGSANGADGNGHVGEHDGDGFGHDGADLHGGRKCKKGSGMSKVDKEMKHLQ